MSPVLAHVRRALVLPGAAVLTVAVLAACGSDDPPTADAPTDAGVSSGSVVPEASSDDSAVDGAEGGVEVRLQDPSGADLGTATLAPDEAGTSVTVEAEGMPPGWHGFHVHATGLCEPDSPDPADATKVGDFLSAGGHVGAGESVHGDHTGDLPALQVAQDGTASMEATTDRFTVEELLDADGSAVMVHSGPDNLANVPPRYAPGGPDAETLATGDSGTRIACGVVERRGG